MSTLLTAYHPSQAITGSNSNAIVDPFFADARDDVRRVLEILEKVGSAAPEMQKTRTGVLRTAFEAVSW
jgi:hypothetical protein